MPTPNAAAHRFFVLPDAPPIETERLLLRLYRAEDLDARAAMMREPETVRYVGGAQSREECWGRIQRYVGHFALHGYGLLAVVEKASGRLAGEAGLAHFERGLGAEFDCHVEAGYIFAAWARGQGYAREAMAALIADDAARRGPRPIVCIINPANAASLKLAGRLGFMAFDEAIYHDHPVALLRRDPGEAAS